MMRNGTGSYSTVLSIQFNVLFGNSEYWQVVPVPGGSRTRSSKYLKKSSALLKTEIWIGDLSSFEEYL